MALASGTKLGPYEIIDAIGAGGMGEVYRARDTRLERTVAIKVLPEHLADTPEARQRFEYEARAVSALNHTNICTLFDVGSQNGTEFLVMEYLEGETLAARLEKGALPFNQALKVGMEVADALDKAHRAGIIHRDLKPGNIMLTKSGSKLLDFGVAKAAQPFASSGTLTAAATRTTPVTQRGTIVGTFQYMSPEQVEASELDARSDLFSFGSVLYEMLTGRAAFPGRSQLSVASAILEKDPEPICALQPMTPRALDRTVRKCLAKDPEDRWQTARDLLLELKWIAEAGSRADVPTTVASRRKARERAMSAIGAIFALTTVALTTILILRVPKAPQPIRLTSELGADAILTANDGADAVLSRDGTRLAFVARGDDEKHHLFIRSLDQLQANVLPGTEDANNPFFSPDGQWIAFFTATNLKKVSLPGGTPVTLCDVSSARGGSWGEDGTIVFASNFRSGLSKVSASGGTPEPLTTLDKQSGELTQRWPQLLPGSKAVLFTSGAARADFTDANIGVYSIASGKSKTIVQGGYYARYLPTGYVVYVHNGTLFAVPFDLKHLEVTGESAPAVDGLKASPTRGGAQFAFSDTGTLVYVAGSTANPDVAIYWMDAVGNLAPLRKIPGQYGNPVFSPDGKRMALEISNGNRTDIWVYEWERDTLTRITTLGEGNIHPVWTPDGRRIVYSSLEKGAQPNLWWIRADGAGAAERLIESKTEQYPGSLSPDGRALVFFQLNSDTSWDIMTLPIEGSENSGWKPGQSKPFVDTPFVEVNPAFSPNGHWIAYQSLESGRFEIYVRNYPGPGGKWQISTDGGFFPEWSLNGKELFFRTADRKIMDVTYSASEDSFHAGKPRLWSPGQFADRGQSSAFALHPDGKRFAVLKVPGVGEPPAINKLTFIFNFFDELRGKALAGKN